MPWTSKYNAQFTKPLVRQLVGIIQRDQRAALDFVGGAGVFADFQDYQFALTPITQFPAVQLTPLRIDFDEEAVGTLHQVVQLGCVVAVSHQDPQPLAELLEDYVRAVDAIFNTIVPSDFTAALTLTHRMFSGGSITTAGIQAGSAVTKLFVASHDYSEIKAQHDKFAMAGILSVIVEMEEK